MARAAAMPPQGKAALQYGVVDVASADLKAVFGGRPRCSPPDAIRPRSNRGGGISSIHEYRRISLTGPAAPARG